jgi:hypothetical protein
MTSTERIEVITVAWLAFVLDMPEHELRVWLRDMFPRRAPGKGGRWDITMFMARKVVKRRYPEK